MYGLQTGLPYSWKYWRNKTLAVQLKVYGVNFYGLLLKFMCGWGLLNTCTYANTFDTTSCICGHHVYKNVWTPTLARLECRRRRQWFWSICCSCAKERCCCWPSTLTSANLYVRYGTARPSCWLSWAPLQIEECSRSLQAVSFLLLYSSTCRRSHVVLYHIF